MWPRPPEWPSGRGVGVSCLCAGLLLVAGVGAPAGWAEEVPSTEPVTVEKSVEGLRFNVPPDWPIEERAGLVAPIPIEEYLGKKFQGIESRLKALDERFKELESRLEALEQQGTSDTKGLRSVERPTESAAP